MDTKTVTKQVIRQIPTGVIMGAVCAFALVGIVYSAWMETLPDKVSETKADETIARRESIELKRNELFSKIVG